MMTDPDGWSPGPGWMRIDLCWPLQAGDYNILCRYVMSFAPMYQAFDGTTWSGQVDAPFQSDIDAETDRDGDRPLRYYSVWWHPEARDPLGSQTGYATIEPPPLDLGRLHDRLQAYKEKKRNALDTTK